ncbi:RidA family protein [Roseivirga misakiensis]|uniref:Reactive intermediate/imine deaminase n=1 Tax=Roseivirga misakiensis TaxID=1563681 RepID=A0A1E5SZ85_9BACT|nr:Rid family detoxifying hydrolase [Roseivirga misakiensis]OEK04443.1 reactive intermediate/imine deaminase [Roseivirga misakiensis]
MEKINAKGAPEALGPYVSAVRTGNLVFCSGQTGINPETGKVDKTCVEGQTKQVMRNLAAVLDSQGLTLNDIVKCNVYLSDIANFDKMNVVYGEMLAGHTPARTTVAVAGLPLNALVEIECIAEVK